LPDIKKHRILVVDDEALTRESLSVALQRQGYEVAVCSDSVDALSQLQVRSHDVIISDLDMPHQSGVQLLSAVRDRFPAILIVATSATRAPIESAPSDVTPDAFYAKGGLESPELLFRTLADLLATAASRVE